MDKILLALSNVFNLLFIISAVTFGVSLAVKTMLIKTVKKINQESSINFDNIKDFETKSNCENAIEELRLRYEKHTLEVKKTNKIKRKNKVRKLFKLSELKLDEQSDNLKDIFISLFRDVSYKIDGKGGYLNFSKNELFAMVRTLIERLNKILNSTGIIWLKTIKIPFYIEAIKLYGSIEKITSKPSVILVTYIINFCLAVSRFISPVSATKKLAGSLLDDSFSSILASTLITVIGKEWAVLCYEKELSRQNESIKVA